MLTIFFSVTIKPECEAAFLELAERLTGEEVAGQAGAGGGAGGEELDLMDGDLRSG